MKLALFAAALMLGGAAYAQSTDSQTGSTPAQTGAGATGGMTVPAANTAPKRDARGVPVVSADAQAPAGWNAPPSVGGTGASPAAPAAPMAAAGPLPPCTRKVTDHCTQTYERGRAPSAPMAAAGDTSAATTADAAATTDDAATTGTKKVHHRRRHRG
jgi:hypothetical protein